MRLITGRLCVTKFVNGTSRLKVKGSKGKLETVYNFQTKHWVGALREACANIKSMWSNLANRLKKQIRKKDAQTLEFMD
ncbi:MAG: hypothetical protein LKE56_06765 [Lactobacillus delbrueckii]|nr:hypothetical protein [Lactobacillus delbrueckii]